ncbi:hypothetical protein L9F63_017175 [Diploptera punctata]|uniref:Steroid dehydrogenase n=1 Tax=Diploptera punctata TaxID=6984 RepID=A0AAD8A010_DIPPU|nr:hypothetical protein L9F63_017175 [Diploptera punctata]
MGYVLEKVGVICLSVVTFQVVRGIIISFYNYVFGPFLNNVNLKDFGHWAVVTDAYDGIGKAYAEALANAGMNVILMGKQKRKLDSIAAEIESEYRVQTKIIEADFITDSIEAYDIIQSQLCTLDVGVLINNVSMSYPHPEYFLDLPHRNKIFSQIIKCNISSVTNMTLIILPRMVERGRGVIVNVSASAATIPSPLLTVYGATEAYIEKFSKDLACEYSKRGVIIQCILPGIIATKKSTIPRSSWLAPTPKEYVIGLIHFLQFLSPSAVDWLILRAMENIRCRAIQRYVG